MFPSATVLSALLFASAGLGDAAKRLAQIDHVDHASASVSVSVSVSALPSGFSRCLFYDDFSEPTGHLPDASKWHIDLGTAYPGGGPDHWGTGEIQTYTSDAANMHVTREGTLKMTPVRAWDDTNGTWAWTSSRIETTPDWDFACPRGHRMRVEARIRLGGNPRSVSMGIWPAFWVLGSAYRSNYSAWPSVGEVDILESVNGEAKVWQTLHCGKYPGGVCNEPSGIGHVTEAVERASWHTLSWEVDRRKRPFGLGSESVSWLVDGERRWTLREADLHGGKEAWHAVVANSKMVLLNVAVGGALPNAIAKIDTPTNATRGGDGAAMEVDYVAVYSWSP
ncbi:hypothetical protein EsDP_00006797 [Epichloe bromicola]|uniref:GH16 domain-containing protein n=1 Tax=Epichloe bromicola TaxID=79588 RepID=A0ABQ0CYQ0_9HYPO